MALKDVMNVGVPVYENIFISNDELLMVSDDVSKTKESIQSIERKMRDEKLYVGNCAHLIEGYNYVNGFIVVTSQKNSVTSLVPDPTAYFCELQRMFGLEPDSSFLNFSKTKDKLLAKISEFYRITNKEELKIKFPRMYGIYMKGESLLKKIKEARENKNGEELDRLETKYYRYYVYRTLINPFIEEQTKLYRKETENFEKVRDFYLSSNSRKVVEERLNGINENKFKLLLAYKYFKLGTEKNTRETWQEVYFYLINLVSDNSLTNEELEIEGRIINKRFIKVLCEEISTKYNLVPYNAKRKVFEGKSKEEVEEIKQRELNLPSITRVEKEKLPPTNADSQVIRRNIPTKEVTYEVPAIIIPRPVDPRRRESKKHVPTDIRYIKSQEELNRLLERKQQLLETNEYIEKFLTDEGYNGVIFFVYPNGIILRERYYDSFQKNIITSGEAMYRLDKDHFLETYDQSRMVLTRLPNTVARRIKHDESYEPIARGYIELPSTEETTKDTETLIHYVRKNKILVPTLNKKYF